MESVAVTALFVAALAMPVAVYLLLTWRIRLPGLLAAVIAVVSGWAMNVAWAFAAAKDPAPGNEDFVSIAVYFGWICPSVLVLLTWLVCNFRARRLS